VLQNPRSGNGRDSQEHEGIAEEGNSQPATCNPTLTTDGWDFHGWDGEGQVAPPGLSCGVELSPCVLRGKEDGGAMITTVTSKNQVSLPSALAAQAGILPGARLEWSLDPSGDLRARPLPSRQQSVKSLRGRGRHLLAKGQSPVAELITERTRELS